MHNRTFLFLIFLIVVLLSVTEQATADEAINIGSRLELLVDDYLIEKMDDSTELRLHHPVRREVIMKFDRPWEGNACGYFTVIQDGDLYRMYYRGSSMNPAKGKLGWVHPEATCYIESRDGVNWTRPDLGIVEYEGSKKNNIILMSHQLGEGKGHGVSHNFSPFLDKNPDCKPSEKYKALGGCGGGLYALKSPNGVNWSFMSEKPVVTKGAFDSQNLAFWDSLRNCYMEYHRAFREGRDVMLATSKDFLKWSQPEWLEYTPGRTTQLYTNQIEPYYRAPHLYVGFPARYIDGRGWYSQINEKISKASGCRRCGTDYTDTGFISSRDGKTFKVWPEAFVRPGPSPEMWMYGFGYTAWGMVETKPNVPGGPKEISFYISDTGGWFGPGNSMCRYTLRQDGFVSARAPLSGGSLLTKPIVFEGEMLKINFETSAAGSLQVEIQNIDGKPVPGFSLSECPTLFGNSIDHAVRWKGKAELSDLAGKPIRLRFVLKDADLYAFRFGKK
ncbi:MAG: hypothetical protein JXM70_04285 [Pirellulales bacterium]|nr:hypothetical protein [Pirellulales bacterium]